MEFWLQTLGKLGHTKESERYNKYRDDRENYTDASHWSCE